MAVSRRVSVIIICSFSLVIYSMFVNNLDASNVVSRIEVLFGVPYDTARYFGRFLASALLLGVAPVLTLLVLRIPIREIGLAIPKKFSSPIWWAAFLCLGVLIGLMGSFDPNLRLFYPFHPRLSEISLESRGIVFAGHSMAYFFLYYLGWEITFRGVFVVCITEPFVKRFDQIDKRLLVFAILQAVPSAIIHFGHPETEIVGALLFGFAAGYFSLVTRSILPGLIVHAIAGISLDLLLVVFA